MRSFLFVLLSIVFVPVLKAQLLDVELHGFSNIICDSLKKFGEVDSTRSCIEIKKLIYSRQIELNISTVKYYEIGLTVSHGYKFVGILSNRGFMLLRSKDFSDEYSEIINPFLVDENAKVFLTSLCVFFKDIKDIYDYNVNSPWKKKY